MQIQHTPQEITQLKTNARFILDYFDKVADVNRTPSIFTIMSMLFVCGAAYSNLFGTLVVYTVLMGVFVLVTINSWRILTNVYTLHMNREVIDKQGEGALITLYESIVKNYKNAGFGVFTSIIELYFIVTYNDALALAVVWGIVCMIPIVYSVMCRNKYFKIRKVHEYAVQNS